MTTTIRRVDLRNEKTCAILNKVIDEGSVKAYRLEKGSGLAHSTFWDIFQPLIKLGYLEIESREPFRTGQEIKNYRISSAGFFEFARSLALGSDEQVSFDLSKPFAQFYPRNEIWDGIETMFLERRYLCPWLADEIMLLTKLQARVLARSYVYTCVTRQGGGITVAGGPPPHASPPFSKESLFWGTLVPFLLEALYPDTDIGAFGIWHSHYPGRILRLKPNPKDLRSLQVEIRRYLEVKKDLSKNILEGLRRAETQVEILHSTILAAEDDFRVL